MIGPCPLFPVLGLSLDLRNGRHLIPGLRMRPIRPGHSLLRHVNTSGHKLGHATAAMAGSLFDVPGRILPVITVFINHKFLISVADRQQNIPG